MIDGAYGCGKELAGLQQGWGTAIRNELLVVHCSITLRCDHQKHVYNCIYIYRYTHITLWTICIYISIPYIHHPYKTHNSSRSKCPASICVRPTSAFPRKNLSQSDAHESFKHLFFWSLEASACLMRFCHPAIGSYSCKFISVMK